MTAILDHGGRMRMGISSERFGGQVLSGAAPAGLAMAAGLALAFGVFGDWLPATGWLAPHRAPVRLGFGPFMTVGPVLYAVWLLAACTAWLHPRWQSAAAWTGLLATIAVRELGGLVARPFSSDLLLIGLLALPAALATRPERRRGPNHAVAAGLATFVVLGAVAIHLGLPGRFDYYLAPIYWSWSAPAYLDVYLAAGIVGIAGAVGLGGRRVTPVTSASVALLACPWLAMSFVSRIPLHVPQSAATIASAAVVGCVLVLLAGWWITHLRKAAGT